MPFIWVSAEKRLPLLSYLHHQALPTTPIHMSNDNSTKNMLAECIAEWPQIENGIHYKQLVDYHSYNAFGTYSLSNEEWDNREMILNFKNNSELTDPISHQIAMTKAIQLLTDLLEKTFGTLLPQLTLACIPASTAEKTEARFKEFAKLVTDATGMANGYEHIHIVTDQDPEHLADSHLPKYAFDNEYFNGRNVLLFDDIMATGKSMGKFATHMEETGANVTAAVVLGKTVTKKLKEE